MLASHEGHFEVVKLLCESNRVNVNQQSFKLQQTALHDAASSGFSNIVELLLDFNIDPDIGDGKGVTALWDASKRGYVGVVEILLNRSADVDLASYTNSTPWIIAASNSHIEVVEALLVATPQPDLERRDDKGNTALHAAFFRGYNNICDALMDAGSKDTRNLHGNHVEDANYEEDSELGDGSLVSSIYSFFFSF
jgi:ankyrin repeat protein